MTAAEEAGARFGSWLGTVALPIIIGLIIWWFIKINREHNRERRKENSDSQ